MKRFIKMLPPKAATAMLAAAVLLLLSGSVGGTRAALTYYSDTYSSQIILDNIGVTLEESNNGTDWKEVSRRNYNKDKSDWDITPVPEEANEEGNDSPKPKLFANMLGTDESLIIGKNYREELRVKNTGTIGEYVRVTIYKYWVDLDGEKILGKNLTLDPDMIELKLANTDTWLEDKTGTDPEVSDPSKEANTSERTVLYYNQLLPVNTPTPPFTESLTINRDIVKMVAEEISTEGEYTVIKSTYDYDGKQFCVEVEVDAVQDHNAEDAILSAWGRNVTIKSDGTLELGM